MKASLAALTLLLAFVIPCVAADPDFAFIKKEMKGEGQTRTKLAGRANTGKESVSLKQQGVLVGFDLGIGKFFNNDIVIALKPIYLTPEGTISGESFGIFDSRDHPDQGHRRAGIRTVTLQAKKGFAISEIHVDSGLNIDHLQITYAKITEQGLDTTTTYKSIVIGRESDTGGVTISTSGTFATGVFGRLENSNLVGFGLIHLKSNGNAAEEEKGAKPKPTPALPPKEVIQPEEKPQVAPKPQPEPEPTPDPVPPGNKTSVPEPTPAPSNESAPSKETSTPTPEPQAQTNTPAKPAAATEPGAEGETPIFVAVAFSVMVGLMVIFLLGRAMSGGKPPRPASVPRASRIP